MTDWPAVLLDGSVGGILAALATFWSAVWVVKRQSRADRELAYLERRLGAAVLLYPVLLDISAALTDGSLEKDRSEITKSFRPLLNKFLAAYVPAQAVSPDIKTSLDAARAVLTSATRSIQPADDSATVVAKLQAAMEAALPAIQDAVAVIAVMLEREGAPVAKPLKQSWWQFWR